MSESQNLPNLAIGYSLPRLFALLGGGLLLTLLCATLAFNWQHAKDVTAFLTWAAEPHLVARKRAGMQVMIFLIVLSGLLYFTKKKVWRAVSGHA